MPVIEAGLRADVHAFASAGDTNMDRLLLAAVKLAAVTGHVTADDLRECIVIGDDDDKRVYGSALARLKSLGIMSVKGNTPTREKKSHGRPISVFVLTPTWRQAWLACDRLPVPAELVNLQTPALDVGAQASADELFAVLAEVHEIAWQARLPDGQWASIEGEQAKKICELTQRWARAQEQETDDGKQAAGSVGEDGHGHGA